MRIQPFIALATIVAISGLMPVAALAEQNPTATSTGAVGQEKKVTGVENKKEVAKLKAERLGEYISQHVAVLKDIIARLESRIVKIEARGLTAEGQKKLESAKKNLTEAKTKLESAGGSVVTLISDVEKALGGDDVKAGLTEAKTRVKNPRTLLSDAIVKIKAARKDIGDALGTVTKAEIATSTQTATSSAN